MPQYELNLRDYVRIFRRRKTIILLTFILVLFVSSFFAKNQVPSYEAVTTVKIEERKTVAGLLTEWIVFSPGDMMESESKLITGYPVLKKTAYRLGVIDENSDEQTINAAVHLLEGKLKTERLHMAGFDTSLSRCSAVDGSAPATKRAAAAVSPGRPGRRRAIGFLLTSEAGGTVMIGDRVWQGEDPLTFPSGRGPNIVAASAEMAEKLLQVLK